MAFTGKILPYEKAFAITNTALPRQRDLYTVMSICFSVDYTQGAAVSDSGKERSNFCDRRNPLVRSGRV